MSSSRVTRKRYLPSGINASSRSLWHRCFMNLRLSLELACLLAVYTVCTDFPMTWDGSTWIKDIHKLQTRNTGDGGKGLGIWTCPSAASCPSFSLHSKDPILLSASQPLETRALKIKWALTPEHCHTGFPQMTDHHFTTGSADMELSGTSPLLVLASSKRSENIYVNFKITINSIWEKLYY